MENIPNYISIIILKSAKNKEEREKDIVRKKEEK